MWQPVSHTTSTQGGAEAAGQAPEPGAHQPVLAGGGVQELPAPYCLLQGAHIAVLSHQLDLRVCVWRWG